MKEQEPILNLDTIDVGQEIETLVEPKRPYFFQLDVLKAIAIAFVVMDHSLTWEIKGAMGGLFWERLSIPFFLIVMGFNMAYSFKYSGATTLRELYAVDYFKHKFVRYVLPFAVLYMGSILLGLWTGLLTFNEYTLLGVLPFWGPGNWFIALLFGSIVVFPFIYWSFERYPKTTVILCFLAEIILQGVMYIWLPYPINSALEAFLTSAIRVSIFIYLPAVGLGIWFSKGYNIHERRNWFIWPYLVASLIFMFDYSTGILSSMENVVGQSITWIQYFIRGDYTLLFYGYAAFLFLAAMMFIPQNPRNSIERFVQHVGKASYHILLFQIFYMSIVYYLVSIDAAIHHEIPYFEAELGWPSALFYIPFYLMNLAISFTGGLLWYKAERKSAKRGKPWWQHVWMKRTGLLFSALMSIFLLGVSLELIAEFMGLNYWAEHHGPIFVLNEITGPGVMASFLAILFFIGLCMALMYKAFTLDDDDFPI